MMDKMNTLLAVGKNANRLEELKTVRLEKQRTESDSKDDFASELGAELMQAGAMAQQAARPLPEAVKVSLSVEGAKASVETSEKEAALKPGLQAVIQPGIQPGTRPAIQPGIQPAIKDESKALADNAINPALSFMTPVSAPTLGQVKRDSGEKNGANRMQSSVEKAPLTMNTAASTNTAAAIAGLKPWSKEWVFDSKTLKDIQKSKSLPSDTLEGETEMTTGVQMPGTQTPGIQTPGIQTAEVRSGEQGARIDLDPRSRSDAQMQASQHSVGLGNEGLQGRIRVMPRQVRNSALSGNEFVATLSALKGGMESGTAVSRLLPGEEKRKAVASSFENSLDSLNGTNRGIDPGMLQAPGREFSGNPQASLPATEVTGHVVKGAMSQDRLSTESLQGITGGVRSFSAQGGGEMKVRLRPDHLGELTIRVSTQGNQVGLKIQASSEESKKILEESLSHLKESMATQKLELGQVDLSVTQAGAAAFWNDSGMDHSHRNHQQQSQGAWADQGNAFANLGNPSGQSRGNWGQGPYESSTQMDGGAVSNPGLGRGSVKTSGAAQVNGRLDVRA